MTIARRGALALFATPALASGAPAQGAWRPERPVRVIVPFPPGGLVDSLARPWAARMQARFGQPFVVENRTGAGGNIGADAVAKSAPDGHTILVGSLGPLLVNQWLYAPLPYDPRRDLAPVALLVTTPKVFCVNPTRPWTTLAQLTDAARAAPGRLLAGSAGNGSSLHIAIELWQQAAGVQVTHVPYRGAAPAVLDLVAGQIDLLIDNVPNILGQVRGGQARALAVATERRLAQLPEVPTTSEAGLEGFRFADLGAVPGPAGGPGGSRGVGQGGGAVAFAAFLARQRAELEPVVRGAGMRAE